MNDMSLIKRFEKQYHLVIGKDGQPTGYGQRFAAMELIKLCEMLDPQMFYGNSKNGMMNIENIQALAKEIGVI